jgi:sec-independent protein translocase protein TatB
MFGIGVSELLVILVLATIFLGPEKMVEFAGQLGRWVTKLRAETSDYTREFRDAFNVELGDIKSEITEVKQDIEGLKDVRDTLAAPLEEPGAAAPGSPTVEWGRQATPGRPVYNLPTQAPTSGPAARTPGREAASAAPAAASSAPEPTPEQALPEPEIVRDLDPNAEAIEISVGVMVGEDYEAEPLVLEGPVLMEEPPARERARRTRAGGQPPEDESENLAKDAGEEA